MDFGAGESVAEIAVEPPANDEPVIVPAIAAVVAAETAQRAIDDAYVRGVEDGRTAAEAELPGHLERQKQQLEQSFADSRAAWCSEEGERIAEQCKTAILAMEERIAQATARALRPFLTEAVRTRAIDELRATLNDLVARSPGIPLELSGPEDLITAVRAGLAATGTEVSLVPNEASDVQVKAGGSILETRIAAWLEQIEGPRA
jgi:hypothetical protein